MTTLQVFVLATGNLSLVGPTQMPVTTHNASVEMGMCGHARKSPGKSNDHNIQVRIAYYFNLCEVDFYFQNVI